MNGIELRKSVDDVAEAFMYGESNICLCVNASDLLIKLKEGSYRPQPVIRQYIPKAGSDKMRPLGILVLEDKIVQGALVIILRSIYEENFLPLSLMYSMIKYTVNF